MDIADAMAAAKRLRPGQQLRLTFLPGEGEQNKFGAKTQAALEALLGMNLKYFFLDGSNLKMLQTMILRGRFGIFGREVIIELCPEFLGHRKQFLKPLVDSLESLKAL
ncbi:MAG: hypothetical protein WCX08_03055 [Candidatus Buchananbacteria bacterium]|jgi:hypothetical protein